jgi:rod shape determining protein RodA
MSRSIPAGIASLPWGLFALLTTLSLFGTAVLYSAAGGSMTPWAGPHLRQFVLFAGVALVVRAIPLGVIRSLTVPAYVGCLLLLILVEVIGQLGGGSQRWLNLGFMTLQPSELMKIAVVLALARFYETLPPVAIRSWTAIWPAAVMLLVPAALIAIQPDLDTGLVVVLIGAVIMFLAGLPLRLFLAAGAAMAVLAPLAYLFALKDYQRTRLLGFLDPESDPLGTGYHAIQAKVAIGSGGLWGKGFLNGTQSHLDYLPEHHTDLIFATLFEEWGLIGGLAILFAFMWLLHWGARVAQLSPTRFGKLLASGLTITLFSYVAMNIATATALTPIMGVPLPLISHGGTAMLTVMLLFGLLMAVQRDARMSGRARNARGGVLAR